MIPRVIPALCLCSVLAIETGTLFSQQTQGSFPSNSPISDTGSYQSAGALLIVTVFDEKNKILDRQSVIKLENLNTHSAVWQTTTDKSEAPFVDLATGRYEMEVSAVGYVTAHKSYSIGGAYQTHRMEITLQKDPASVVLEEPNRPDMPAKARKAVQRAVRALKSNDLKQAKRQLDSAYKIAPNSPDVNFFFGYLEFVQHHDAEAQSFLAKAVAQDGRNVQALILLGRVRLQRGEYVPAESTLEEAVLAQPDSWVAHKLLAEALLAQHQFEKARDQAEIAIRKGNGSANSARLALGQALASLGKTDEAVTTLQAFLKEAPVTDETARVTDLISALKSRTSPSGAAPATFVMSSAINFDDMELRLSVKSWEPAGIDDSKPAAAEGVVCPVDKVMNESGRKVKQMADDIGRFAAIEELQHERVDELGHAIAKETRRYNYVASISEAKPGYLEVSEYRMEHSVLAQYPDGINSSGFTALALVFHPDIQGTFQFSCEGLGEWRGQATWLVHFRQREDRPNRIHDIKVGGMIYPINLKGRAWISADSFQILHIESQLIRPMPGIQLLTEHQIVDYGPVQFKGSERLWLPSSAELYFDFRKHRYHRRHSFSHFMLFSTNSQEMVKEPKLPAPPEQNR